MEGGTRTGKTDRGRGNRDETIQDLFVRGQGARHLPHWGKKLIRARVFCDADLEWGSRVKRRNVFTLCYYGFSEPVGGCTIRNEKVPMHSVADVTRYQRIAVLLRRPGR